MTVIGRTEVVKGSDVKTELKLCNRVKSTCVQRV